MKKAEFLTLKIAEALKKDVGRAIARIDPEDMSKLHLSMGDIVTIEGRKITPAKIMPCYSEDRGKNIIQIDGIVRGNAKIGLDEKVNISKCHAKVALKVTLEPITMLADLRGQDTKYIGSLIEGLPVVKGDTVRATLFGSKSCDFTVVKQFRTELSLLIDATHIKMKSVAVKDNNTQKTHTVSYEDIGGLGFQLQRIREMIELPLRFPKGI